MKSYQKQWFGGILLMQAVIVLVFLAICFTIPFSIIVGYVDDGGRSTLQTLDEDMMETMHYAEQSIHFLARTEGIVDNLEIRTDPGISSDEKYLAQFRLRRSLLSAEYSNPEFTLLACITPDEILTSHSSKEISLPARTKNATWNKLLARDVFDEYLDSTSGSDPQSRYILIEQVTENTYLAALLEYDRICSPMEPGIFIQGSQGRMLLADGDAEVNSYMHDHAEGLFGSAHFGVPCNGFGFLKNLHLIGGRLYFRSEYCTLESDMRYIYMQELTDMLRSILRSAGRCAAMCLLAELLLSGLLWKLTGAVLKPFRQLSEYAGCISGDEESLNRINRLMKTFHKKRIIQRQVYSVYALTLLPVILLVPVSISLLGKAVSAEEQRIYVDSIRQVAETVDNRIQRYQKQNMEIALSETTPDLILNASGYSREENNARLERIFLSHGLYMRGLHSGVLFDADGHILAESSGNSRKSLNSEIIETLSSKYDFSFLETDAYGENGTVMVYAIRSTQVRGGYGLYQTLGYLLLETDPVMNFDTAQNKDSFYYLYQRDKWGFVETPDYLPFRNMLEGICQSGMLRVDQEVDSRIVILTDRMLAAETYLPGFAQGGKISRMLVASASAGTTGLTLVSAAPMTSINQVGRMLSVLLFALLAFACAMLLVAMFFTHKLMKRVRIVESYFESVNLTDYELPEQLKVTDEISALAQAMRDSIVRINSLKQAVTDEQVKQAHMQVRKREAEIIALQSQMDSHLICNVFATMKLLLHDGEYALLGQVIEATGNFLRSGLTHNEYNVTLEKEFSHVQAYLQIQSIRFGSKLCVEWQEFDRSLLNCRVPKYLLQPILENAIKHGMRPNQKLTIRIYIFQTGRDLSIRVSNDGYGLSSEEVSLLNLRLARREMADHIGLSNVQERIALRYGPHYGLTITSGERGLTWVDILLPIHAGEEESHVSSADRRG